MACYDTCVDFANGLKLPYNASRPGNYTLPDGTELEFDVPPEYLNESRDSPAIAALLVIFVISLIVSGSRIYVRATTKAPGFGWDDGILLVTAALYVAFVGIAITVIQAGEGRHILWIVLQGMIDVHVVTVQETLDFTVHLVYNTALYCCRLSALAFYQRLSGAHPMMKWMIIAGYVIITCFYLPQMFTLIFHCDPVTAIWPYDFQIDSLSTKYTCLSWGLVYLINGCLSVASDLIIFVIPACLIAIYNASASAKLKLAMILFPGVLVIGVSSARLGILSKGIYYDDQSWYYGPMLGLEGAEIGGTMMALSIPALKVFYDRTVSFASRMSSTRGGTQHSRSTDQTLAASGLGESEAEKSAADVRETERMPNHKVPRPDPDFVKSLTGERSATNTTVNGPDSSDEELLPHHQQSNDDRLLVPGNKQAGVTVTTSIKRTTSDAGNDEKSSVSRDS